MRLAAIAAFGPVFLVLPHVAAQNGGSRPPGVQAGPVRIQPGGFIEDIAVHRTTTTKDGISTRYGSIPLVPLPGRWDTSFAHSRVQAYASMNAGPGILGGYYEMDFLNSSGDVPYRTRQLWGEYGNGKWKVLGGQAWSLLRPNRLGTSSKDDLMNTIVVDPAYHTGLAGLRKQQFRITRIMGSWQAAGAVEFKSGADFTLKIARDWGRFHVEGIGLAGHASRFGASLAAVVAVSSRVTYVSQLFWSQNVGPDIVGTMPAGAHAHSTLHGVEVKAPSRFQFFGYGGIAYATRTPGNRIVRQWTAGFHRKMLDVGAYGSLKASLQYSQVDRAVWSNGHGAMNYVMFSWRYLLPARY